jgi:hypothetical protein
MVNQFTLERGLGLIFYCSLLFRPSALQCTWSTNCSTWQAILQSRALKSTTLALPRGTKNKTTFSRFPSWYFHRLFQVWEAFLGSLPASRSKSRSLHFLTIWYLCPRLFVWLTGWVHLSNLRLPAMPWSSLCSWPFGVILKGIPRT